MTSSTTADSIDRYRQQFPALANKAYFNYGGQGPMPQRAIDAIQQAHLQIQITGPFSNPTNQWIEQETQFLRHLLAQELGTTADTMTITEDVTVGCNIALWGVDWQAGDHLLLSDCEHPGVIAAALEIQRRFQIEISTCPLMATLNDGDPVAVIAAHLRPTTRLVVLSHILWNTGQVLPLQSIAQTCHTYPAQRPIWLLVDAAQSAGVLPLNLTELEVDFYAFTGHKWYCGPAGVGGLYVRPAVRESLHPTFIGWRSIRKNAIGYPIGWQTDGRRYEVATSDYALFPSLRSAIDLHHEWGDATQRYNRICTLSRMLWENLATLPNVTCLKNTPPEAGLVSFQLTENAGQIVSSDRHQRLVLHLEKNSVFLRTILDPNCVRACVHYFSLETEIEQLIDEIKTFN